MTGSEQSPFASDAVPVGESVDLRQPVDGFIEAGGVHHAKCNYLGVVMPDPQVWFCNKCGRGGPMLSLVMDNERAAARANIHSTNAVVDAVLVELQKATEKFGPFASAHEGYAVLLEEVDELWHEVKHGSLDRQREEAVQVAAMALRFLIDVTPLPSTERDISGLSQSDLWGKDPTPSADAQRARGGPLA